MKQTFLILIFSLLPFSLYAENFVSPFGQKFIKIKSGEFTMGTKNLDLLSKEVKADRIERLKKNYLLTKLSSARIFI